MEPNIPSPVCRKDGVPRYTPPSLRTSQKPFPSLRYGKTAPGFWCATAREKPGSSPADTGSRTKHRWRPHAVRLYEETGALRFRLCACGCYSVTQGGQTSWVHCFWRRPSRAALCPKAKSRKYVPFPALPSALTYPTIQPVLHACANTCAAARWKTHLSSARPYGRGNARERCSLSSRRGDCRRGAA